MLPEKAKEQSLQLFELSENKIIRERQLILKVPEVQGKLTSVESMLTEATTKPIIKELPQKYIIEQIAILVPMICRDLGIVKWKNTPENEAYTKTRFYQTVTKYYSNLSFSSLKLAFEMLSIGQLDDYLPKDKNQQPEKNHYQEFSFEFYTRVLNAYVKKTSDVWGKVRLSLPKVENYISLEEQTKNKQIIIEEIYNAFDNFSKHKTEPNFDLEVHLNALIEFGLIEKKKPTPQTTNKAYNRLLIDSSISNLDRKLMIAEYQRKRKTHKLEMESQRIENNNTIKAYFEKLIAANKNIREFLKQIK